MSRTLLESPLVQMATKIEVKQIIKYYLNHGHFPQEFTSDCRVMTLSKQCIKDILVYTWGKEKQFLLVYMNEDSVQKIADVYSMLKSPNNVIPNEDFETFTLTYNMLCSSMNML